jgi:hypothetical protein
MLADGGGCLSDLCMLRDHPDLFGSVASDATVWRMIDDLKGGSLTALRWARAAARRQGVWCVVNYQPGAPEAWRRARGPWRREGEVGETPTSMAATAVRQRAPGSCEERPISETPAALPLTTPRP